MNARFAGVCTVGAVIALLAIGAPLQAQSGESVTSGVQGRSTADAAGPSVEAPTWTLPFEPSVLFVGHCEGPSPLVGPVCASERWQPSFPLRPMAALGEAQAPLDQRAPDLKGTDFNRDIYYKNKLEFSLESGWLPINIPFPFDFLLGDGYNFSGLYYTLVPVFASVRWQLGDVRGPRILRGNWDWSFTLSATAIPRGPETRYFAYIMGIRRNFVRPRWRIAPFVDGRLGLGDIDAKGPLGVDAAQGQNFTFTLNIGSGVRYNFNPRYAISAGVNWMHISNLYLSQPKFLNYGINVYGPMFGIEVQLPRHRHRSQQ